ncbi:zinc finger protein CONSTANS-LIKE 4 [Dorcoceras hygrometricum]|nr:zinc finger protein CONSTANS-LIKE 4 [Dorcoceras hygrometricum]
MAASFPDPHYLDHTNFSTEFFSSPFPIPAWTDNLNGDEESSNMSSNSAGLINYKLPPMNCDMNSPVSVASFPETFGALDCMAAPELSEFEMGFRGVDAFHYKNKIFEPGEEDFMLWQEAYHMVAARGIQPKREARVEETEVKVGRYSVEERRGRILRYLQKRNQRNFNKTIKYACRKTLADKRVRVRGRFAKNNEPCDNGNEIKNTTDPYFYDSLDGQSIQMKNEEDDWLEVAVASLAYLPYTSG